MSLAYLYPADCTDFSTIGVCGALEVSTGTCEIIGNGMMQATMEHVIDKWGKYRYIESGMHLKIEVPVRTTPEIEEGQFVTQVETYEVKSGLTKAQRYVYSKKSGGTKKKLLSAGTKVTVTSRPADGRWKIKTSKTTGWMTGDALEHGISVTIPDSADGIEKTAPSYEQREQYFIITDVTKTDDRITVNAIAKSYQLMYNLTTYDIDTAVTLQEALDGVLNNCIDPHDFHAYTNIQGTHTGAHYADIDPITAIFNPETGLATEWGAQIVRDNWDIYLLDRASSNHGMRVEYAKNLQGITFSESKRDVATRIRPIGEKKDGKKLYLTDNDGCVDSQYRSLYPFDRIKVIKCDDCKVGTNGVTESIARTRMRQQAEAEFAAGADMPTINIQVVYENLGNTEKYKKYRDLENAFVYDTITVRHPILGIDIQTDIVRIVWDWVHDKMQSTECGSLAALMPSVSGWQITGGVSGRKLIENSVGSAQLGNGAIDERHLQPESVNTNALQANSVTANHMAAGAVETKLLSAVNGVIEHLEAGSGRFDNLDAAYARLQVLIAGSAQFDRATIGHLISSMFNLDGSGTMEDVYIYNLVVTFAQISSAIVHELALKGDDGHYYRISVSSGQLTPVLIPDAEIDEQSGMTTDGKRALVDSALSQLDMTSGPTIKGLVGVINRIYASVIDTDTLLARKAFVDALYTSKIFGGTSLEIVVGQGRRNYIRNSKNLLDAELITGDVYQIGTGLHIIAGVHVERIGNALHIS